MNEVAMSSYVALLGLWKHPDDTSSNFNNLKHWTNLAKMLEAGHFHGMFIADV